MDIVFSAQVTRQTAVQTGVIVVPGNLWFIQVGGIADVRFTQLGVMSLRSVDEPVTGFHSEFFASILYAALTGFTYTLPDQIPQAEIWVYVAKPCPIPDPVITVYQL